MPELWKIRVSTWEEAKALGGQLNGWIFRGQTDSGWKLISTLERAFSPEFLPWGAEIKLKVAIFGDNRAALLEHEETLLREFQRRAPTYLRKLPGKNETLGWFSLMQHYGCATRLLDFSRSFYVAAYFAVETPWDTSAIWCIDPTSFDGFDESPIDVDSPTKEAQRERANQVLSGNAKRGVVCAEPFQLDERIAAQQGLHLIGGDPSVSFEANLCAEIRSDKLSLDELGWQDLSSREVAELQYRKKFLSTGVNLPELGKEVPILKIEIPSPVHRAALLDLHAMNVTAASLFPGLEGLARSLNLYTRFPPLRKSRHETRFRSQILRGARDRS